MGFKSCLIILFSFFLIHATQAMELKIKQTAPVYSEPNVKAKKLLSLPKGKIVKSDGTEKNGFYRLKTKSGKPYWISKDFVENPLSPAEDLILKDSEAEGQERRVLLEKKKSEFPIFTYDLGFSFGEFQEIRYSELNLGVNTYFNNWFVWRNALFGRFIEQQDNIYGLDTSLRGVLNAGGGVLGLHTFLGPGYRFVSEGENVPFFELGLVFKIFGFQLGGGAKTLMYSSVYKDVKDDVQYFIILSGSGVF